ncbi:MAG: hypothetical protein Q4G19_02855 [Clostridia bacterium]|nr:hypothetical protein [Clostridia bacterium]
MKKFLAIVLAAMMLCLSCFALAEDATKTTMLTLYLDKIVLGEQSYSAADLGMVITMAFYDDGTVDMSAMGETATGTWAEDGENLIVTLEDGSAMTMTVDPEDPTTVIADAGVEGEEMIYYFTTNEISGIELPAIITAADISEFDGTYTAKYLNAFDITANIESMMASGELQALMGDSMTSLDVVIENGKVTAFGAEAIDMVLTDGTLAIDQAVSDAADDMGLDLGLDLSSAIVIQKTETGIVVSMLAGMLLFYCE